MFHQLGMVPLYASQQTSISLSVALSHFPSLGLSLPQCYVTLTTLIFAARAEMALFNSKNHSDCCYFFDRNTNTLILSLLRLFQR